MGYERNPELWTDKERSVYPMFKLAWEARNRAVVSAFKDGVSQGVLSAVFCMHRQQITKILKAADCSVPHRGRRKSGERVGITKMTTIAPGMRKLSDQ